MLVNKCQFSGYNLCRSTHHIYIVCRYVLIEHFYIVCKSRKLPLLICVVSELVNGLAAITKQPLYFVDMEVALIHELIAVIDW